MSGTPPDTRREVVRRWRDYRSPSGARPVQKFQKGLDSNAKAAVLAAMKLIKDRGVVAGRHLRGDLYEARASYQRDDYRIVFSCEGPRVLLALHGFKKTTRTTPGQVLRLAQQRLSDWRRRGET